MTIRGFLLDITGVLYESGNSSAIKGSVETIQRLKKNGVPFKFLTNETQSTRQDLVAKLRKLDFDVQTEDVVSPGPATRHYLQSRNLRPYLLVHPDLLPEFAGLSLENPNCVVLGDVAGCLNYEKLNQAFRVLINKGSLLITMGKGKFYREKDQLALDVGSFAAGLEYASDCEAKVVGKPSPQFFQVALKQLGLPAEEVAMVGDDIVNDVGAAQTLNMKGILVRTGKYRPSNENHPVVKPDAIVDNLQAAIDLYLSSLDQSQKVK